MINLTLAREKFSLLAELEGSESEKWKPLVMSCVQDLENRLLPNADVLSHASLLADAAAADAFYRYCVIEAGRGADTQTVGSVTVKRDAKGQISAASLLRSDAFTRIRHLIRDEKFIFVSV